MEKGKGAFIDSLTRNNKEIRTDRAIALVESTELLYKRKVEDIGVKIKQLQRDKENMLDLSPDSALSLKVPSDFDAGAYVEKNLELALKIRNEKIRLLIAEREYIHQFIDSSKVPPGDISEEIFKEEQA